VEERARSHDVAGSAPCSRRARGDRRAGGPPRTSRKSSSISWPASCGQRARPSTASCSGRGLLHAGRITEQDCLTRFRPAKRRAVPLGEELVARGIVRSSLLLRELIEQVEARFVELFGWTTARLVSARCARTAVGGSRAWHCCRLWLRAQSARRTNDDEWLCGYARAGKLPVARAPRVVRSDQARFVAPGAPGPRARSQGVFNRGLGGRACGRGRGDAARNAVRLFVGVVSGSSRSRVGDELAAMRGTDRLAASAGRLRGGTGARRARRRVSRCGWSSAPRNQVRFSASSSMIVASSTG